MNYTTLRDNMVRPKITAYGKVVYLRRPGVTATYTKSWDAATSRYKWTLKESPFTVVYTDPAGTPVDVAGHAVEKPYKQSDIDNTTVMAGDRLFITSDLPSPTTADKLIVSSAVLTIVNVVTVQPGSVALTYKLQCRGV
jgi:hypothetical protein